jgi:signal transduction histidine kinase
MSACCWPVTSSFPAFPTAIRRPAGIGIASGDLGKIFQDFRQGNGGLDRPYGGLGIGLSLARRLTEILGGEIRVDSHPDQGSVFEVLVPVQIPG